MISLSSEKFLTANATIALKLTFYPCHLQLECFYAGTLSFAHSYDGIIEQRKWNHPCFWLALCTFMFALRSSLYRHKVISLKGYCAFIFGRKTRWFKQGMMTQLKQKKKIEISICFTFWMWPPLITVQSFTAQVKSDCLMKIFSKKWFWAVVYNYIPVHNSWSSCSSCL